LTGLLTKFLARCFAPPAGNFFLRDLLIPTPQNFASKIGRHLTGNGFVWPGRFQVPQLSID
jgi:hypothetical protein